MPLRNAPSGGTSPGRSLLKEERHRDADQGQRLGQRETDPQEAGDTALGLRLTRDRLDELAEDEADTDAGADGGQTVGERAQVPDVRGLRVARRPEGAAAACGDHLAVQA